MNNGVEALIAQYLTGSISAEDFHKLEQCLRENPEARRALRRDANLDSALRDWASRKETGVAWLPARSSPPARIVRWQVPLWLSAAAVVAFAAFFFAGRSTAPGIPVALEQQAEGAAVLTASVEAEWGGAGRERLGDTLMPGSLVLRGGWVQIEFFSGAALIIAGPAEFEIVSPWEVALRHGKVRVRVPPAARGFRLMAPGMKLVDLGTEFGVQVDRDPAEVQVRVFSGEVQAYPDVGDSYRLTAGQGLAQRGTQVSHVTDLGPDDFPNAAGLSSRDRTRAQSRYASWRLSSSQQRRDPRLIAYYAMEQLVPGERVVRNVAEPCEPRRDGGAVGVAWAAGRWPEKSALEFKRPGDRVRLDLDGTYTALTLTCWVRIDGLDRKYNGLLLTDGYETGEPHWQIFEDGRLMFSLVYNDPENPALRRNQIYYSPVVFNGTNTGRWHHLAVVYDNRTGTAVQYLDGVEVSREVSPFHSPNRPLRFGPSELGNWGLPTSGHQFPIRNLNGRLDEFAIYSTALPSDEIYSLYEAGRPE